MKVAVVIPALNEADCIGELVAETLAQPVDAVIVVDNGSTDETAGAARQAGARVVREPRRGYGAACSAGVRTAQSVSAETIVFLDADRSFEPREMPRLLEPLRKGEADMVLGSRFLAGQQAAMLPHQRFGNWLTARLMRGVYGLPVTDLGPYRAIRIGLLTQLDMHEMTYGWPTEMIVKAARHRARIVEVPVSYRPRRAGISKVSGTVRGSVLAGYFILWMTLKHAR